MSLPMVHLAVAYNWRSDDKNFKLHDDPDFYLGAISPDAIHARRDSTRDDKHKTHLDVSRGNYGRIVERFWDSDSSAFAAGYGLHILTDRVWVEFYRERFPELFDASGKVRADQYYNDTDQVDFMLYDRLPYRKKLWKLLEKAEPKDFCLAGNNAPLLTADEIKWWKNRTMNWFNSGKSQRDGEIKYLTYDAITYFISIAPKKIDDALAAARIGAAV